MNDPDLLGSPGVPLDEVVFTADLGGTHLRTAVVDGEGKILFRYKQNTPHAETPDEIVRAFGLAMAKCKEQCSALANRIHAISVAVPGSVRVEQVILLKAPNVP
jgi:predicted NBD/HSP70 family sugar kinase